MKNVFLGEYIKQRRLDLGLTQEHTPSAWEYLSDWKNGAPM